MAKKISSGMSKLKSKISKPESLRVLIVEDSEDDVLLIIRELKKGGYHPVYERVETAAAMKKALKEKQWDIILCDYKLPKFNVPSAIALLKETDIDIPVIVVSGSIGEETAVECMRSGAKDYMMKLNLSRLCPAIARELEETDVRNKQKQAESQRETAIETLKESEEKYRNLVERASDGIGIAQEGTIHYANTRLAQIGGYTVHEIIGKPFTDFFTPEEVPKVLDRYKRRMAGKKVAPIYETALRHKNGSRVDVEVNAGVITYKGNPADLVLVRDITERKRMEKALKESEVTLLALINAANDSVILMDTRGVILNLNKIAAERLGRSKDELLGTYADDSLPEDIARMRRSTISQILESKETIRFEDLRDGIWFDTVAFPIMEKYGTVSKIAIIARDITERKQAEKELRESEERFRLAFESSNTGMCLVDLKGNLVRVNNKMCEIFGYAKEELERMTVNDIALPEDIDKSPEFIQKSLQGKIGSDTFEKRYFHKKGHVVTCQVASSLIRNAAGSPLYFISHIHDITERKQLEESLVKEQEEIKLIIDSSPTIVFYKDKEGRFIRVNRSFAEALNMPEENFLGKTVFDLYSPQTAQSMTDDDHEVFQSGRPKLNIIEQYKSASGIRWVQTDKIPIFDKDGVPIGLIGFAQDITERRQAEEKLRKSEERMKSIFSAAPIGIGVLVNRVFVDINERISEMTGYSKEELIGTSARVLYPTQADFDYVGTEKYRQIAQRGIGSVETRWRKKDDKIIDILLSSSPLNSSDLSRGVTFTALDITDRKTATAALTKSEEKYRKFFDNDLTGDYLSAPQGKILDCNEAFVAILGFSSSAEVINSNFETFYLRPTDHQVLMERLRREKKIVNYEVDFVRQDGQVITVIENVIGFFDSQGAMVGFQGYMFDITERKRTQDELHKRSEELQTIIESSPIMIYFKDTENRFLRVNKAVVDASGLAKEEIEGKSNEEINPTLAVKLWEEDKEIITTGNPKSGILETIKTKSGLKILQTDKVPYKNKEGNIIGIIGFSIDITEQRKAQEELLKSEEKYRNLVENAQEGIYQSTTEGRHLAVNRAFARMLGYASPQEVMTTITDIAQQLYVNSDDREKLIELVNEKDSVMDFETQFYKKDGGKIWVSVNMHAVRDEDGRLLYYQGIDQDITEKKMMEMERQDSIKRLRKSLGATINAMAVTVETRDPYTAGHQRRVSDLARAIATEMNLGSDQIDSVRMASMIHDIGKISIPSEILTKPTELTKLEYNLIKTHSQSGYNILKDIDFPWPIARIVLEHHERMNGSGYPNGLTGEQILLESKIIAIADVVEAISSHRPYRAAYGIEVALDEITKNKGTLYDPELVDACLRLFREKNYKLAA